MRNKRKKLLIFLENIEQYDKFHENTELYVDYDREFCALTPQALQLCVDNRLPFCLPEECYHQQDYFQHKDISERKIKHLVLHLNKYFGKLLEQNVS